MPKKLPLGFKISKELNKDFARTEQLVAKHVAERLVETMGDALEGKGPLAEPHSDDVPFAEKLREEIREFGFQSEMHCPGCGTKGIWCECGEGDYYQGPTYWCNPADGGCNETWHLK